MADRPARPADPRPKPAAPDVAGVLMAAPLPMVLTTSDARVVFANRAMQRLIGVPVTEIAGRFLAEFAGPPHGRLRRLAAVAVAANHPVTTEVSLSVGRRRSISVRVVVSRAGAPGQDPTLVWQVTSSPTAHALPLTGEGPATVDTAGQDDDCPGTDAAPAQPTPARSAQETGGSAESPEGPPATLAEGEDVDDVMQADAHVLTLEMIRTSPDRPVEEVAERLAELAGRAFGGRPLRIGLDTTSPALVAAATDPLAALAVQAEAELGGGPVTAAAAGELVVVEDLGSDGRFPSGPEIVRRFGVVSALAVPVRRRGAVVGSLAVYADCRGAFDKGDVWLADWVAAVVGGVLDAAILYRSATTETEQLRTAMSSRAVIEQAKGILMARHRVDEDEAFGLLRVRSQTENRRLREVAVAIVGEATAPQP